MIVHQKKLFWGRIATPLFALLSVLLMPALAHASTAVPQKPSRIAANHSLFIQQATTANTSGDSTFIDNSITNGNPNAVIMVTQLWNPLGNGGTFNNHPVGVWYDASNREWAIFNEDGSAMTPNAAFNVYAWLGAYSYSTSIIYTQIGSSVSGSYSAFLSNSITNLNYNAIVLVTPNWNPVNGHAAYDNHPIGVWYDWQVKQWAVFNEDGSTMPAYASFNVFAYSTNSSNVSTIISNTANTQGDFTNTSDAISTSSSAYDFVAANFNPGASGSAIIDHNLGVWFNPTAGRFAVFNEDQAAMPSASPGIPFNLITLAAS